MSKFASQFRHVAVQLALHCFLVIGTGQCSACNLFARKLNLLARLAVPLLSFRVAVTDSVVVGSTGLSPDKLFQFDCMLALV